MKKALSYLLLFSYMVILVKPVLPYVSDFLAHAFWKYEHIATVHKEFGKTHIHFELQNTAKENKADKNNTNTASETQTTPHISTIAVYDFTIPVVTINYFPSNKLYPSSIAIAGNYPPPKASYFF